MCVLPARLPVLTWVPSSVPPRKNIRDTFPAGSMQDTTKLLGVRFGVKTRGACTYEESKGVQHHASDNQGSRLSRHRRSSVRGRAETAVHDSRLKTEHGLRCTPAEVALVHRTGYDESLVNQVLFMDSPSSSFWSAVSSEACRMKGEFISVGEALKLIPTFKQISWRFWHLLRM